MVQNGDVDGALTLFFDTIDGEGAWRRLPAAPKQQLRDNAFTLVGQVGENRKPFARSHAESIKTPTLLIGGGDTPGALSTTWRVLAQHIPGAKTAMIPGARHWIFDQAPQEFSKIVLEFLAA
jgi:pimeloyl-ACP methyl ester carboxylesterase